MNVLDEIKNSINGAALLKDWLGADLLHVTQEKADHRSLACLRGNGGAPCPYHRAEKWWERTLKSPIARVIRHQLRLKARLRLSLAFEDQMKMCAICGCCVALKAWTPIDHIRAHTPAKTVERFPDYCWQKQELAA